MNAEEYIVNHWVPSRAWEKLTKPQHRKRLQLVSHLVTGSSYLDVGCALGHSIEQMKEHRTGLRNWSGLDFSRTAVNMANELYDDVDFYYARDFNLRPVCGEFDTVTCLGTIEHIKDDKGFVKGLLDIARQTIIITTTIRKVRSVGHLRVYTPKKLHALFKGYFHIILAIWPYYYVIVKTIKRTLPNQWNDFINRSSELFYQYP